MASHLGRLKSFLRSTELNRFAGQLPRATSAIGLAAIFCLFATIGLVTDIMNFGRGPVGVVVTNVLFAGAIAVGYA
jgi:hypothetical protein